MGLHSALPATRTPALAAYSIEFNEMFGGLFHHRKTDNTAHVLDASQFADGTTVVKSYFSPTDDAQVNAVIPLIDNATHTLDIAMFFLASQAIGQAIHAAKVRGVQVRVVIDAGGAANPYSQVPALCASQIPVKWENWGGKSHRKWLVADSGDAGQAAVVFRSMNLTGAGNVDNDENTLYVRNDGFAAEFQVEFDRQWADLASVPGCTAVSAEGADSSSCSSATDCTGSCTSGSCCDGSDGHAILNEAQPLRRALRQATEAGGLHSREAGLSRTSISITGRRWVDAMRRRPLNEI